MTGLTGLTGLVGLAGLVGSDQVKLRRHIHSAEYAALFHPTLLTGLTGLVGSRF